MAKMKILLLTSSVFLSGVCFASIPSQQYKPEEKTGIVSPSREFACNLGVTINYDLTALHTEVAELLRPPFYGFVFVNNVATPWVLKQIIPVAHGPPKKYMVKRL